MENFAVCTALCILGLLGLLLISVGLYFTSKERANPHFRVVDSIIETARRELSLLVAKYRNTRASKEMVSRRTDQTADKMIEKDSGQQSAKPASQPSPQVSSGVLDATKLSVPTTTMSLKALIRPWGYADLEHMYEDPDELDAGSYYGEETGVPQGNRGDIYGHHEPDVKPAARPRRTRVGPSPKEIYEGSQIADQDRGGIPLANQMAKILGYANSPEETPSGCPSTSAHPSPSHPSFTSSSTAQSNWWYNRISEVGTKEYAGCSPGDQVETRVVGVTFEGRQTVVAQLSPGEQLWLRREPHNPHDRNAIRVERQNGQQIGYISRAIAALLAPHFDNYGKPVSAVVTVLVGKNSTYSNLGVRIRFKIPEPPPPVDDYYSHTPF
jgi:hypothetical protein